MTDSPRPRLVVLFGGVSAERDVSCVSAAHVLAAVDTDRYDVEPIGIDADGRWLRADDAKQLLADGAAGAHHDLKDALGQPHLLVSEIVVGGEA